MSNSVSQQATPQVSEQVIPIAQLMSSFRAPWALCGGWAVDAWLGRLTRDHGDVDIAVFVEDQQALFDHLAGWQLIAHDPNVPGDTSEPWDGRSLDLPGHIHARIDAGEERPDSLPAPAKQGFNLDIQLDDRSGDDWILSREPRLTIPLRNGIRPSPWGLPTVVPEILLFFKAGHPHGTSHVDFRALLPHLTEGQRDWLRSAITVLGHPWLSHLST